MLVANRRHDVVAFDLSDPLEHEIANVGVIALEDAESGRLRLVDTGSGEWRREFTDRVARLEEGKRSVLTGRGRGPGQRNHRERLCRRGRCVLQNAVAKAWAMRERVWRTAQREETWTSGSGYFRGLGVMTISFLKSRRANGSPGHAITGACR